ncbi:MAG: hypothetical protein RL885_17845 [Planctomycetota bacterium]
MKRDATLFLGTIAILALGGLAWMVFTVVLAEEPLERSRADTSGEATWDIEELRDENRQLRNRLERLESELDLSRQRIGDLASRIDDRTVPAPSIAPTEADPIEQPLSERVQPPSASMSSAQELAVRDIILRVQEEEEQRREEVRLERELERMSKTVERLAGDLGLSQVQQAEVGKLYSQEVIARRALYRDFDNELASEEDRIAVRQDAEDLRRRRDEAVLRLLDVGQAEKYEERNRASFRRGRALDSRIRLGGDR